MRHSFAPLDRDAVMFLCEATRIDYTTTDFAGPNWLCVSCRDEDGLTMGVAVFEFQFPWDAHFSAAVRNKRCISLRLMRAMFRAVFVQATRVTALVEPWNAPAIRQAELMGFQREGFMRNAIEGNRDGILYGMLIEDCHYLKVRPRPPVHDVIDCLDVNVKAKGEGVLAVARRSNGSHIGVGQLGRMVALAALISTISFSQIGLPAFPPQMAWIDAGSDATGMSSVPASGGAMSKLANNTGDLFVGSIVSHLPISMHIQGQRPDVAVIATIGEDTYKNVFGTSEGVTHG